MNRLATLLIAGALLTACYRTHYVNFSPHSPAALAAEAAEEPAPGAWRHFFVWGWFPDERIIDARAACGGAMHIASIQTQRTFLEGLVESFAGYYVNVYSPYDGAIYCTKGGPGPAPAEPAGGTRASAGASLPGEVPGP